MIIKLIWAEVGKATEAGRYETRYGLVEITADDLWVWSKYPNAAFVLMRPFSDDKCARLGSFELREHGDPRKLVAELEHVQNDFERSSRIVHLKVCRTRGAIGRRTRNDHRFLHFHCDYVYFVKIAIRRIAAVDRLGVHDSLQTPVAA